jgi:phosphoribosylglycinamide formyltransferase 1
VTARICVLVSGSGTNLQAILDACAAKTLDASVVGVISDRIDAFALERATAGGVPVVLHHPRPTGMERRTWDASLAAVVALMEPDWIVLAGFMRLLSSEFLDRFPNRVINLHPALPGELPGINAIERAFDEFRRGLRSSTGITVHRVPDEGVDSGPVLASTAVAMYADDSLDSLTDRMHACEHELLISSLQNLILEVSDEH